MLRHCGRTRQSSAFDIIEHTVRPLLVAHDTISLVATLDDTSSLVAIATFALPVQLSFQFRSGGLFKSKQLDKIPSITNTKARAMKRFLKNYAKQKKNYSREEKKIKKWLKRTER